MKIKQQKKNIEEETSRIIPEHNCIKILYLERAFRCGVHKGVREQISRLYKVHLLRNDRKHIYFKFSYFIVILF